MMDGFIYVVGQGRLTKVGRSIHRFDRLAAYVKSADELLVWSSPRHARYMDSEARVISELKGAGLIAKGREWSNAEFMSVVRIAKRITAKNMSVDEICGRQQAPA